MASELFYAIEDLNSRLHLINCPLLVLHGGADSLSHLEGPLKLMKESSTTEEMKKMIVYEDWMHDVIHDTEKERMHRDIVAWLDSHSL